MERLDSRSAGDRTPTAEEPQSFVLAIAHEEEPVETGQSDKRSRALQSTLCL